MATDLKFDVSALDRASKTFANLGRVVERFERKLEELDGKRVQAEIDVKTDKAERAVGKFAADLQKRVADAAKNLPEIEITADSSDADRELAAIRAELVALGDKRIGVDIDAAEAQRKAAELQARLTELSRSSTDVRVQADTAAAVRDLAVVSGLANELDGKNVKVKVDLDTADSLIKVAALGKALALIALPAALVAATPQLASLGAAAISASGAIGLLPAAGAAAAVGIGALAVGMSNVSDALGETDTPAKAKKVAEAFAALSPAAKETVTQLRALGPAWGEMTRAVQENLFDGVAQQIKSLADAYLPRFKSGLGDVTAALNTAGKAIAGWALLPATLAEIDKIFANTSAAMGKLAPAAANVLAAFTDIASVGSGFLPGFADSITRATQQFREFVAAAKQSGELKQWIQGGVDTLRTLWDLTKNVGAALKGLFSAADLAGLDTLGGLERATRGIADAIKSLEGQRQIATLFREISETFGAIASAAGPVLAILGQLALTVLPPLLQVLQFLAPVLIPVAAGLLAIKVASAGLAKVRALPEWLGVTAARAEGATTSMRQFRDEMRLQQALASASGQSIGRLGAAMAVFETAQSGAIAGARAFRDELVASYGRASGAVEGFAAQVGGSARQSIEGFGERVAQSVQRGIDGIVSFGEAGQRVAAVLGERLAAGAQRAVDGILGIPAAARSAASTLATGIGVAAINTAEALRSLPAAVKDAASTLKTGIGVAAINAADALRRIPPAVADVASTIKTGVGVAAINARDGLVRLAEAGKDFAATAKTGIGVAAINAADGIKQLATASRDSGKSLGTDLRASVTAAGDAIRALPAQVTAAGQALATGLRSGVTAATEAVRALPTQIAATATATATAFGDGLRTIPDQVRTTFASVGTAVQSAATSVADGLRTIPDHIRTAFSSLGSAVDGGISALGRFTGAVSGVAASLGTGLMRAGSSLVSFLGGPWGVAFAAAGLALSAFTQKQADAAAAAAEYKQRVEEIKNTLNGYDAAVTSATTALQANDIAGRKLSDGTTSFASALQAAGVDLRDYTDAATGNEHALQKVNGQLVAAAQEMPRLQNFWTAYRRELEAAGVSYDVVGAAAIGNSQALEQVAGAIGMGSETIRELLDSSVGGVGELGSALGAYAGQVKEAQEQTRTAAEASRDFGATLKDIGPALGGLKDGAAPLPPMAAAFKDLADSANTSAQAAGEAAAKYQGTGAGAEAARAKMQELRDAFIASATSAGLTAEQAAKLADQIGLVPAQAATTFTTNAAAVVAEIDGLKLKIDSTTGTMIIDGDPNPATGKVTQAVAFADGSVGTITVDARPDPATGKINGTVTYANGSTGTITIDGNQKPADGKIEATITKADGSTGTVKIDADTSDAEAKLSAFLSKPREITVGVKTVNLSGSVPGGAGGFVAGFAGGGVVGGGKVHKFAGGGRVFPGYAPGRDRIPALLSPGEAVLVPELVRRWGADNIMRANMLASGGRPGTRVGRVPNSMAKGTGTGMAAAAAEILRQRDRDGDVFEDFTFYGASDNVANWNDRITALYRRSGIVDDDEFLRAVVAGTIGPKQPMFGGGMVRGSGRSGSPDVVAAVSSLRGQLSGLRSQMAAVTDAVRSARPITVEDRSGSPTETARMTQLALRLA